MISNGDHLDSNAAEHASSLDADIKRVYELKDLFSLKQDTQTTQDDINTLLEILRENNTNRVLQRNGFSTLIAILSNVQARSLSADSVNKLYRLFTPSPKLSIAQDEQILSRLKVFDLTTSRSGQKPDRHDLEAIVSRLAEACFHGARGQAENAIHRPTAAPPARMQAIIPSSGSMGSFAFDARPSASRRPARRSPSMSSISSRRSTKSHAASDSEASESDTSRSSTLDSASIRLESLRALAALTKLDTRALHPHWPTFFGPTANPSLLSLARRDLSLAVRSQAIQTAKAMLLNSKGYLDLSRESKTTLAFTPLSQTLAEISNDVNFQVIDLLRTCFTLLQAKDLLINALQLASAVIANSPYDRLQYPHLDNLVCITLENVAHTNDLRCSEAMSSLLKATADIQKGRFTLGESTGKLILKTLDDVFERIRASTPDDVKSHQAQLWSLFVNILRLSPCKLNASSSMRDLLEVVQREFTTCPSEVQEQQLECLLILSENPDNEHLHTMLRALLLRTTEIGSSIIKSKLVVVLVAIPSFLAKHLDDIVELLKLLAKENNRDVRMQTMRSSSKLLQQSTANDSQNATRRKECLEIIIDGTSTGASTAVRAEAYWNLANIVDSVPMDSLCIVLLRQVLDLAIEHVNADGASRDAEMIRTSSIRLTGSLLCSISPLDGDTLEQGRAALASVLISGSPKAQWNAAAAMKKLITSNLADSTIIESLVTVYKNSKNSKVQTSVMNALQAVEDTTSQAKAVLGSALVIAVAKLPAKEANGVQESASDAPDDHIDQLLSRLRLASS